MVSASQPGARAPTAPAFSVVIPARDAAISLAATLEALDRQTDAPSFEVLVVDDGSGDDTARIAREAGARVLTVDRLGPAAARNRGIRAARGHWVALLGADTPPDARWLAAHASARAELGDGPAVIGRIDWHPAVGRSPFLRYVGEYGPQFGFRLIREPENVEPRFFCSSNVSLPRRALLEAPFDERFKKAAWEDVELGMRLRQRGTRIVYRAEALALHLHPTSMDEFLARQRRVGAEAWTFRHVRPGAADFLGLPGGRPPRRPSPPLLAVAGRVGASADARGIDLRPLWWYLCRAHYRVGVRRAWERSRGVAPF